MDRLKIIVKALDDKRAEDIDVLNISELTSLGDYFVICTCNSNVQVRAAADEVELKAKEAGFEHMHVEGYRGGSWILLDLGDIIVHVMDRETREFYSLERLWDDAKKVDVKIIKTFLETDRDLLKQEMDYLQPNVIVCSCDDAQFDFITRNYLADEYIEECDKIEYAYDDAEFVDCCLWYYKRRNLAVVKSYHPTNRGKIQWTIFERVVSPFRKLLEKHPEFFENF